MPSHPDLLLFLIYICPSLSYTLPPQVLFHLLPFHICILHLIGCLTCIYTLTCIKIPNGTDTSACAFPPPCALPHMCSLLIVFTNPHMPSNLHVDLCLHILALLHVLILCMLFYLNILSQGCTPYPHCIYLSSCIWQTPAYDLSYNYSL